MKVLIVDDDPKSHTVMGNLLAKNHDDIEVVGNALNLAEGIDLMTRLKPALVFLDIELPDGKGFDLVAEARTLSLNFQVIFITSHDKYAVTAIRFGALDFLVKPIDEEELFHALARVRGMQERKISDEQMQILIEAYEKAQLLQLPSRLAIASLAEVAYIEVEEIIRLEADKVYTKFFIVGEENPLLSSTNLGKYVEQFKLYKEFIQVHRSHLVNLKYVRKYIRAEQMLLLKDGSKIGVSKAFLNDFKKAMVGF